MQDRIWICRDGRQVPVRQMSRQHVLNAIAMIQRSRRGWRREYLERLLLELKIKDFMGE